MSDFFQGIDAVAVKLAGVAGACVSMRFLQGTWPERVATAASGAVISFYAAPYASRLSGLPEGLSGFLLGLFGMSIVSKLWEFVQTFPFTQLAIAWIKKRIGHRSKT